MITAMHKNVGYKVVTIWTTVPNVFGSQFRYHMASIKTGNREPINTYSVLAALIRLDC